MVTRPHLSVTLYVLYIACLVTYHLEKHLDVECDVTVWK